MIQHKQHRENNLKIEQYFFKAMSGLLSKSNIIRLIALTIMSAAILLIFITTSTVFYNHHQRQLIGNFITKDLQPTATTDLSTSVGSLMTSTSSLSILSTETQALSDLHDTTHSSKRNYVSSSAGAQWKFDHPPVVTTLAKNSIDFAANQVVSSLEKGMYNT